VFDGFRNELIGNCVDVLLPPRFFTLSKAKQGVVCGLRAALLYLPSSLLKLAAPMVVVLSLPERAGRSDCEAVDAEVDTEDCLVPGTCRNLGFVVIILVGFLPDLLARCARSV